jgi:hypothetical protein
MRPVAAALAAVLLWAPAASAEVHDSLPELLSAWVAIQEDPDPEWQQAWLRYELSQSAWLDPTLYAGRAPADKASVIDAALQQVGAGFGKQMADLAAFEEAWGADMAAVNEGMRREFGRVPLVELYVAYAMSPAKLAIGELGGKPSICVNARRLLPYNATTTRVLLARYMFEWVLTRWPRTGPPSVADRLHQEGMGTWAAGRVLPGLAVEELLECTPDQLQQLTSNRKAHAAAVLAALDSKDPAMTRRFFGDGAETGAYIGMLVARDMAQELGQEKLPAMSHQEFVTRARGILRRLSL